MLQDAEHNIFLAADYTDLAAGKNEAKEGGKNVMDSKDGMAVTGPGATGTLSSVDESDRQGHDGNTLLYRHVHGRSLAIHFVACNG